VSVRIVAARSRAELRQFVELPYRLYRDDPVWVPPLRIEQRQRVDPRHNPMLRHCTVELFLARDGEEVIGRVAAFLDHLALEHWRAPIGLFGSYECVDDPAVSRALLDAAREWLRARGMASMRGPWSFASQEWGLVVEGFTPPPVLMAPYNPAYYNDQLLAFGMAKVKDLLAFVADTNAGYRIPERYIALTDRVQQRFGITVRGIEMSRLADEVAIVVDLANRSIADNWGFYPATEEEGRAMARDLRPVVDPALVMIAEDASGAPIGFAITLPDLNVLLQGLDGRLLPFGWLKLLRGRRRLQQFRMWAIGVVPEYQRRAVDALLYRRVHEVLSPRGGVRLEANYILEDNAPMLNAMANLGLEPLRRYRVYEMAI
jgi:GNAT superfamily N-acetyltransferase